MRNMASLHPRPSVSGEELNPMRGDPVCTEHSGSKGVNLEKQSSILWCECHTYGMNGSGCVCLKRHPLGYQATPRGNIALPSVGALLGGPYSTPLLVETQWSAQIQKT